VLDVLAATAKKVIVATFEKDTVILELQQKRMEERQVQIPQVAINLERYLPCFQTSC